MSDLSFPGWSALLRSHIITSQVVEVPWDFVHYLAVHTFSLSRRTDLLQEDGVFTEDSDRSLVKYKQEGRSDFQESSTVICADRVIATMTKIGVENL